MNRINFHHLYYFWSVAKHGKLTRAAELLHISQSALSMQIKQLEDSIGHQLFNRSSRKLNLTEIGRITFSYADEIFRKSAELDAFLSDRKLSDRQIIRIGGISTLSRNFQETFVRPLVNRDDVHLHMISGPTDDLLTRLAAHRLDIVLSNTAIQGDEENPWRCRRIAQQTVSLVGRPLPKGLKFRFPEDLHQAKILLPSSNSEIRVGFDHLCEQFEVHPQVSAEVDDMAMLRLLARDSEALAVLPPVVVRDEIRSGELVVHHILPGIFENFYAIHIRRNFGSPLLKSLLERDPQDFLEIL